MPPPVSSVEIAAVPPAQMPTMQILARNSLVTVSTSVSAIPTAMTLLIRSLRTIIRVLVQMASAEPDCAESFGVLCTKTGSELHVNPWRWKVDVEDD